MTRPEKILEKSSIIERSRVNRCPIYRCFRATNATQSVLGGRHVGHLMLDHRGMNVRGPDDQIDRSIPCLTLTGRRSSRSLLR